MKHVGERLGELVVPCGDRTVDLEMADQTRDAVALAIESLVPADSRLSVRARRNYGLHADRTEAVADRIAVIALVGDQGGSLAALRRAC